MKNWFKQNWKVITPFIIAVITDLLPLFYNDKTFMSQLGINDNVAFMIRTIGAFMAMYFGKVNIMSMIGGRKKRKKKPTSVNNGVYTFDENIFTLSSVVTYTSDLVIEQPIQVTNVIEGVNFQLVEFISEIQYTDFESLFFEIEVD